MDLRGFNANDHKADESFDLIPPGEYEAWIEASEGKPTKAGNGHMLVLQVKITKGQYMNRILFDRLNIKNPSAKTEEIAKGTLSAICRAVGVLTPSDSSELHMKPLRIKVATRKREDNGEMVNEIKGYKPIKAEPNGNASIPVPVPTSPTTAAVANGAKASAPWFASNN